MRYYDNGCFYSVSASKREVQAFADNWPGFGDVYSIWAQFHKKTGDLVDLLYAGNPSSTGFAALMDDMKKWAQKRIK